MTSVQFLRAGTRFVGFKAKGHTGYAPAGQDIVCAGVSTLVQTAVLGLQKLVGLELQIEQEQKGGLFNCRIAGAVEEKKLEQADLILNLMYLGLQQIAQEYRKYVQVSVKEVQNDEL
ncbi:MAG TPA: ribosomal-processing cysteine protease Prp [Firmicutes bacterium]|uniref:Ribosomal processing cysteine protease Prp n=1 Tax=Capillibacterium thermochitinicola TaxID=2699427 RepID=A0A8J6I218_9FIRM|nr:ribosomal-processing cysteine protease Prp [Capillibacterium thermochitinicola]MBA2133813.1 ribosomal-processing cysteine protease Prp [Capillibacterium thermochitinicola]HHW13223.1 ribosomal-processing cysteine protease Prp [Bacillota bacterium]